MKYMTIFRAYQTAEERLSPIRSERDPSPYHWRLYRKALTFRNHLMWLFQQIDGAEPLAENAATTRTAERIKHIVSNNWDDDAAEIIAANIDSLAARVEVLMCHRRELTEALHRTRDERDTLKNDIDRLQRELAEARAYISTVIDAPGEGG